MPKVLHMLAGRRIIDWVIEAARTAGAEDIVVVVGHGRDAVTAHLCQRFGASVRTVVQEQQRGTGHAVLQAMHSVSPAAHSALLLYGDTPLMKPDDLAALAHARSVNDLPLAMLTCTLAEPAGYGRLLRDEGGRVVGVREDRDCSPLERAIREVNPGMYVARMDFLRAALTALTPNNEQGELYLTDIVARAALTSDVVTVNAEPGSLAGINDRVQLALAEDAMFARIADGWRRAGATIRTGARLDADVVIGRDAIVEHAVVLRGTTRIGEGARIDVGCVLENVDVAAGAKLLPYSVCTSSSIGEGAQIGPFSHVRPGCEIGPEAHLGNFVEAKKTRLGRGAKANHLAYLGDGDIGEGANVGAGTIFCNYDGFQKHRTVIAARAFIGSDSQLVAPVTVGEGAYVATGTTVTRDVPPNAVAIARVKQENKDGYAPRLREKLKAAAKKAGG
ncbi:MAG: UDP-N-acetylglucosamine diphosphorylase/glucosamine-1-phosphate N-acetyltransferase [Myxococcales bacterium]|nr:UDP-N-acetylglucosamine diphosphorylase/glucosamine-1-phosphate N-acetyltransferase [Myxococcales bacterium]